MSGNVWVGPSASFPSQSGAAFASTFRYGKTVSKALSISMCLARNWKAGKRISAEGLAKEQDLPRPWVARLLGYLSQAGIVKSYRGPGGGYVLSREPDSIRLWEVVSVFQRDEFDTEWTESGFDGGVGMAIQATNRIVRTYLEATTLAIFHSDGFVPSCQSGGSDNMLTNDNMATLQICQMRQDSEY